MTISIKEFNATGVLVTDEIVRCNEAVTINSTTYYRGFLNNVVNENISDVTQTTYGIYTAASKAGTRLAVMLAGYPPDANSVSLEAGRGIIYSTTSRAVYVTCLAHEPIKHNINNFAVPVPYELTDATAITIAEIKFPFFVKFGHVSLSIQGGLPSATTTLTFSNGTESVTASVATTGAAQILTFANVLKVTREETLTISCADGNGMFDATLFLMDL